MSRKLIKVISDDELREYRHASDALRILNASPGSYITAPLLISALTGSVTCNDSYVTSYNLLKVWFQSEEGRVEGIRSLSSIAGDIVYSVGSEIGAPEDVLPKTIGFTAGCIWIEVYCNGVIAIYGTSDGKKDLENSVLDLCSEADPLVGIMNFCDLQYYFPPFAYSDSVLQGVDHVVEKRSLGLTFTTVVPRSKKGSLSAQFKITAAFSETKAQFHLISRCVPDEAQHLVFASLLKYNIQCFGYLKIVSGDLGLKQKTVSTMCEDINCCFNRDDFASRIDECARRIPAFKGMHNAHTPISVALSIELLYAMIFRCENRETKVCCVLDFVEGIIPLPDGDKPSMWDIYMSWKSGCEHWGLGPVLAAPFIERASGSLNYFKS